MIKIWRPKDPKARALIKLSLWTALLTWSICSVAMSIAFAVQFARLAPEFVTNTGWNSFLVHWIAPIWIIFTALMLVWAVARFVSKKLGRSKHG